MSSLSSREPQPTSDPYLIDVPRTPHGQPTTLEPLRWEEIFGRARPLRVEIGFGRSEFLIEMAQQEPEYNYVGFEYSRKRVDKFLQKAHRAGVENIRAVCQNVTHVLDRLIEPRSVDHFYILFPDPWPKRRHAKHRFVQERHVRTLIALLRNGGGISLRTDDATYAAQMLEVLDAQSELVSLAGAGCFAPAPRAPIPTLYQLKWQRDGREIFFLEYEKRAPSPGKGGPATAAPAPGKGGPAAPSPGKAAPADATASSAGADREDPATHTDAEPMSSLREKIARFPTSPGVYLMKDRRKKILYVGKAVNLRSRVRSYFSGGSDSRIFFQFLVDRVADVDCLVTESETEALILENNLIKKHRPTFNIRLRDDKNYICLKVTLTEDWPRVLVTRRYQDDGNLYFGPYGRASAVREMLRVIKQLFSLRTCSNGFFNSRKRPCIEYDIGRCTAPCVDYIGREEYLEDVQQVILFLKGRNQELLEILDRKMHAAAERRQFELAARYRDQIRAIEKVFEVQSAQAPGRGDVDVFAHVRHGETVGIQELVIREGKIINSHCHTFRSSLEIEAIFSSFLSQYYLKDRYIPRRILCEVDFRERGILADWLRGKRGRAVELAVPRRGDKLRLIKLAKENARNTFDVERSRDERLKATLESLREVLELPAFPHRIECYDISNFQGRLAVGSMVVFEDGKPEKSQYRKFRIRTVEGADDYRMMREVLERRLRIDKPGRESLPDLMVIDGGKGQLGVATEVLAHQGLDLVGVIGLAKERRARGTAERVFLPGRSDPLPLAQETPESLLLQRIRDEAHRFAVEYHRQLRKKATLATGLEGIPGIGEKRRKKLLERFGTLEKIRAASEASLAEVIGPRLAVEVREFLGGGRSGDHPASSRSNDQSNDQSNDFTASS